MRLLAVTSPEDDGRLTDAGETIGEISLEGTFGFVVFGMAIGCATALLYGAVRWWLPAGRVGGAAFGLLLLLGLSTVFGPLEPDSRDFTVVGPGWLSIAAFSALALAHGMLVVTASTWLSRRVPLLRSVKDVRWYVPLLLVLVALGAAAVIVAAWVLAAIVASWAVAALRLRLTRARRGGSDMESGVAAGPEGPGGPEGLGGPGGPGGPEGLGGPDGPAGRNRSAVSPNSPAWERAERRHRPGLTYMLGRRHGRGPRRCRERRCYAPRPGWTRGHCRDAGCSSADGWLWLRWPWLGCLVS